MARIVTVSWGVLGYKMDKSTLFLVITSMVIVIAVEAYVIFGSPF
tara:strand:- start:500 stop:634 length:135 start_codon:yes stop_codon:yes gene_type:complete